MKFTRARRTYVLGSLTRVQSRVSWDPDVTRRLNTAIRIRINGTTGIRKSDPRDFDLRVCLGNNLHSRTRILKLNTFAVVDVVVCLFIF